MDGHGNSASASQVPNANTVAQARAAINVQIAQIVGVTIRGILVSSPGIPPHEILNSIALATGSLVASALVCDLGTALRLRNSFKDAFAEGIKRTPPPVAANANLSTLKS